MRGVAATIPMPIILGLALTLSAAGADTLEAPAEVTAQADGSFSFQYTFHKTVAADRLAGYTWFGVENVWGGISADCFCNPLCPVFGPGDTYTFNVSGWLANPGLPGSVYASLALCASAGASDSTVIHSFSSAGVDPPATAGLRFWNEPNPFSTRTTFHYGLAEAGHVRLDIHDLAGRLVARLVDEVQPAGPREASWDARVDPVL